MKRIAIFIGAVLLLLLLAGCGSVLSEPQVPEGTQAPTAVATEDGAGTIGMYFPVRPDTQYLYQGQGNEYASYSVTLDYAQGARMQRRQDNGGTVMARVIQVEGGAARLIFSREEAYYRENFLASEANVDEILLMEPLRAGTSWTLADGRVRRINNIAVPISTPSGDYLALEVVTESQESRTIDYYARDVGLVRSVFIADETEISSTLQSVETDVPVVQTVRFFYPSAEGGRVEFMDAQLRFHTNDVTRLVLAQAYRDALAGQAIQVFSDNTTINSLYLNADGMVYIDLNRAFVDESNAGSAYEAMLLQSVANTFGLYYGADRVLLTIDSGPYQSRHMALQKGEYLEVRIDGTF